MRRGRKGAKSTVAKSVAAATAISAVALIIGGCLRPPRFVPSRPALFLSRYPFKAWSIGRATREICLSCSWNRSHCTPIVTFPHLGWKIRLRVVESVFNCLLLFLPLRVLCYGCWVIAFLPTVYFLQPREKRAREVASRTAALQPTTDGFPRANSSLAPTRERLRCADRKEEGENVELHNA